MKFVKVIQEETRCYYKLLQHEDDIKKPITTCLTRAIYSIVLIVS